MATNPQKHVVTVGRYELTGSFAEYSAAAAALAQRAEKEGDPGVLAYQFYADPAAGTAGNLIIYADAGAWMRHHQMMSQWPERIPFGGTVRFVEYRVLGPLSPEVLSFLANAGITYAHFPEFAAGFVR